MTIGVVVLTILLSVVSNELWDLAPAMANEVLRLAALIDARFPGEAEKLFADWKANMDERAGKVTKLGRALWWLGVALAHRLDQLVLAARVGLSRAFEFPLRRWVLVTWGVLSFSGLCGGAVELDLSLHSEHIADWISLTTCVIGTGIGTASIFLVRAQNRHFRRQKALQYAGWAVAVATLEAAKKRLDDGGSATII